MLVVMVVGSLVDILDGCMFFQVADLFLDTLCEILMSKTRS